MPVIEDNMRSWADEVEDGDKEKAIPQPTEKIENGLKIITEYERKDDGKLYKIVRTYKIENRKVPKSIAIRKSWKKFGKSVSDKPGPNPATTIIGEDVHMQFITNKEEIDKPDDDTLEKLKNAGGVVKCRNCNGDHWTLKCPYKGSTMINRPEEKKGAVPGLEDKNKPVAGKYIPPSLREGGIKKGEASMQRPGIDGTAIRISNLSESTEETDLEQLVKPFGQTSKLFLARDKTTNLCKGFAYVHFKNKEDGERAIQKLNGYGYDHLILSADWSKPQGTN